jgi:hypothetical protein
MKANSNFLCLDCKHNTFRNEFYMLRDAVWLAANPKGDGMLCIGCVEERLNRRLCPADFIDAPVNRSADPLFPMANSRRLLSRISGTTA